MKLLQRLNLYIQKIFTEQLLYNDSMCNTGYAAVRWVGCEASWKLHFSGGDIQQWLVKGTNLSDSDGP